MPRTRSLPFTFRHPLVRVLALALVAGAANAAPIINGSFQTSLASALLGQPIPGWSISGAMDYACIADSTSVYPCEYGMEWEFPATQADGTRAFRNGSNSDFPRDPNDPNEATNSIYEATWAEILALNYTYLSQSVATTPGNNYLLTFQLQALYEFQPYYGFWVVIDQNPVRNLSARTQTQPLGWAGTANQWVTFQIPFQATGALTEIGFASFVECNNVGCDIDLYLDNVSLRDLGADPAVPEPATALLFGLGLPLVYLLRRRSR